jgi:hypothetical protein
MSGKVHPDIQAITICRCRWSVIRRKPTLKFDKSRGTSYPCSWASPHSSTPCPSPSLADTTPGSSHYRGFHSTSRFLDYRSQVICVRSHTHMCQMSKTWRSWKSKDGRPSTLQIGTGTEIH